MNVQYLRNNTAKYTERLRRMAEKVMNTFIQQGCIKIDQK